VSSSELPIDERMDIQLAEDMAAAGFRGMANAIETIKARFNRQRL
jgi:hypothetical protein